jgi:UDP-2,4-diacetamido-2,4,6-trideoxy-beta-L-altropyranose hydrolase
MYANLSLAKERRGQGFGVALIERGVDAGFADGTCRQMHALVKPGNEASLRAFECAGFARVGMKKARATEAVHFVLNKT